MVPSRGRGRREAGRSRRGRRAFTLIELLVVIAIIALLLSLLTPALSQAKELARMVVCASRLHNLNLAVHEYAHEQDGRLPWNRCKTESSWNGWFGYVGYLQPYLNLPEDPTKWSTTGTIDHPYPLLCPAATGFHEARIDYNGCEGGTGYGANFQTLNPWNQHRDEPNDNPKCFPYNRATFENAQEHPELTMMFMETARGKAMSPYFDPESWLGNMPRVRFRHFDRQQMNVLYFDGHVMGESRAFVEDESREPSQWSPQHPFWYVNFEY